MDLSYTKFCDIDLSDPFFNSLKTDYSEFESWFKRKSSESAYILKNPSGLLDGFLYLKVESDALNDVDPPLPLARRIKIGTLKINPHGTRLGERFIKKAFDHALMLEVSQIYVTVFEKHEALVLLFARYGFRKCATKTTQNGTELVLLKEINGAGNGVLDRYPIVKIGAQSIYLLSLQPQWHTRLLPDSILKNEDTSIIKDVSHTNSIHKVYLAGMRGMENLRAGDILLIYRTSDGEGSAHYRSVATSICVLEEYRNINSFSSKEEFLKYCSPYSVFSKEELNKFWDQKRYHHIIRFAYNLALPKRLTRGKLVTDIKLDPSLYWGFMKLSKKQFVEITKAGGINESLIVD